MFLAILFGLPLAGLFWWWHSDSELRRAGFSGRWRMTLAAFCLTVLASYLAIVGGRITGMGNALPLPAFIISYIWYLIALPPALALVVLYSAAVRTFSRRPPAAAESREPAGDRSPGAAVQPGAVVSTRRQVLAAGVVSAAPLFTGGASILAAMQRESFRIRRIDVPLAGLPPALDGLTIAHVSDIHIGRFTNGLVLRRIVEQTNALRADLVLMTGDLIDHALSDLPAGIDLLRRLDAKHGVYLCEGNHDLFESRAAFEDGVRGAGLSLLLNESKSMTVRGEALRILGLRWGGFRHDRSAPVDQDLAETLRRASGADFTLLLAHHPHIFDAAAAAGVPLTLAGHTHGGQLMLTPELGAGPLLFKYWSGLYRQGASALVVSNGVGNWFPLRVNAPAEIIHLSLRRLA
ncbi:putative metallophosphoesterase [Phycisphaerae bacterium RAS1]|nr:putative metallophosphoesterase [Phycisphaerae bacterium RAS1]